MSSPQSRDEHLTPLHAADVKPDVEVVSYLQPLTNLSKELLDQYGMPFEEVRVNSRDRFERDS